MIHLFIVLGLCLGFATAIHAEETHRYEWKVLRVIDGDTVEIEAPYLPAPEKSWRFKRDKGKKLGEAWTVAFIAIVIGSFIPPFQPYMAEGFANL